MAEPDNFKAKLLEEGGIENVSDEYLFNSNVWFFAQRFSGAKQYEQYDQFKTYFSRKLRLPAGSISIVGSAKTGFSLAPHKDFSAFHDESDIDIAIVSSDLYRKAWDAFLELKSANRLPDQKPIARDIFRRFVSLKNPPPGNSFLDDWSKRVDPFKRDLAVKFGMPNDINYRIYESFDAVRAYHNDGLAELERKLRKNK